MEQERGPQNLYYTPLGYELDNKQFELEHIQQIC